MTTEAQVCPKCGAAIQFSNDQAEVTCTYCGATVVKSSASAATVTSVEKEIEDEKLVQEMVAREKRLHRDGCPATAKILAAQTTQIFRSTLEGRAVLMVFTVEVQPGSAVPFTAETKTLVGVVAIDKYRPGTVLDVRYDPQDSTQVSIEGRHNVPESNPEEQERQAAVLAQQAAEQAWEKEVQSWETPPVEQASTPAWGKPGAPGAVQAPAQFDAVTDLGAAVAVYRHKGPMLLAALSKTKPKELVLYQDGLAFNTGGKEIHTWRWPEVTAILTNMPFVTPTHGGMGFAMQEYTLLKGSGEKLVLDDDLGISEVEKLIEPVKDAVYAQLYPPLAKRYGAEQAVIFGPVTVYKANGLEMGGKTYAWADIIEVKVDNGRFTVMMRNDHKHEVRTSDIPNVELLCRLIGVALRPTQLWWV